ncbi:MAG: cadmium-translocating P-type ATPase [Deltaproteobacteria bacterium]|nr:cadmium-translocating P-type ATPase [Deltaproteobacteria bacterium]
MNPVETTMPIAGMTCATCSTRIEKVLSRLPGVESAQVNLASEKASVRFDPEQVDAATVAEAIEKAGYSVPAASVRLNISGMTCATCSARIEKVLRKQPGVASAQVNLASEVATIAFTPGVIDEAALISAIDRAGYGAERAPTEAAEREAAIQLEKRAARREMLLLLGTALLALPLLIPALLGLAGLDLMLPGYAQLALATPVQFIAGARFYRGAYAALRSGSANMDVLVVLGTTAAYALSLYLLFTGAQHLYFDGAAVVIALVMLGKWLEARAKRSTQSAVRALMALKPETACVLRDGREQTIPADAVGRGEVVVVRPGERVPVDGKVIEGESQVDEALITGESLPVARGVGDELPGGAINGDGLLHIEATNVGEASVLSRIIALVEHAQATKPPIQRTVDKVAAVFVPVVVSIALLSLVGWLVVGASSTTAIVTAVAVLVIACPCALGLATPTAIMVGTGAAARAGILIRDVEALELAKHLQVVVFDKTGTLTRGEPEVARIVAVDDDEDALLALVAAAQSGSEHPLARAVLDEGGVTAGRAQSFKALPGRGLEASVEGRSILVGSERLMREREIDRTAQAELAEQLESQGMTVMWVAEGSRLLGMLAVADQAREGAKEAIARLTRMGVETVMLTGDNARAAARVGAELGIARVIAEVLPEDKAAKIEELKSDGTVVAMVGDGVNDAPALAAADVGFAMATGTDVAMQAAGVTLMRPEPGLVADALEVSRATTRKIRQNLFWAFFYNIIGLPLAALGLLNPMVAGGAMAMSSVSVVSNSLWLRRWKPATSTRPERASEE